MATRKLRVDMNDLLDSMSMPDEGPNFCLDLDTGAIEMDGFDEDSDFDDNVDDEAGPGDPDVSPNRLPLPRFAGHEEYDLMSRFAASLDERDLRRQLEAALEGKGAFRRFRDFVSSYPDLEASWRTRRQGALLERALEWFRSLRIEPVYTLRPIAPVIPRTESASRPPRVGLIDMLLLGAPDGKTERIDGRVLRQFVAASPAEARAVFKQLARELCEFHGIAWRNRFIEDRNLYEVERAHLEVDDTIVMLEIDVPAPIWKAFWGC